MRRSEWCRANWCQRTGKIKRRATRREHGFGAFGRPKCQQHDRVERPKAAEAADRECAEIVESLQSIAVAIGNDKAAQHQEEVDKEVAIVNEVERIPARCISW
jgi:ribosomal protein L44E